MNFTAREEYGLKALIHLARREGHWPVQSREIARAEEIPEQFLEQVLAALRRGGLVRSIRGASGGYELARPAKDITAGDVFRALSGPIAPVEPPESKGKKSDACVVRDLRRRVQSAVSEVLDGTTIQQMVDERLSREQLSSYMMHI